MAYSEAKKKATIKYQKKTYDRIELKVKKGEKEKIKARERPDIIKRTVTDSSTLRLRLKKLTVNPYDYSYNP